MTYQSLGPWSGTLGNIMIVLNREGPWGPRGGREQYSRAMSWMEVVVKRVVHGRPISGRPTALSHLSYLSFQLLARPLLWFTAVFRPASQTGRTVITVVQLCDSAKIGP